MTVPAGAAYPTPMKPKLGSGARFAALAASLKGKVRDPKAVAAAIGRKKYGKKRFQSLSRKRRS